MALSRTINGGVGACAFLACAIAISAQNPTPLKPPTDVLQAYSKMDEQGGRLTPSGWYGASKFFVKPVRPPRQYVLEVIGGEEVDGGFPWPEGASNRFRIHVSADARGQIDGAGRFTSVLDPSLIDPSGSLLTKPVHPRLRGPLPLVQIYDLVLTDTFWEFGPNRDGPREVKARQSGESKPSHSNQASQSRRLFAT
jgi:hypothetical protein